MKTSALFLVLAAVATAAPAVQPAPRDGPLGAVGGVADSATGAVGGLTDSATGAVGGLTDTATGALGGLTGGLLGGQGGGLLGGLLGGQGGGLLGGQGGGLLGGVTGLLGNLLSTVKTQVLPVLAGQPESVVHKVTDIIDGVLKGLPVDGAGLPDTSKLADTLKSALDGVLSDQGLVGQVIDSVTGTLSGVKLGQRDLPLPIDVDSLVPGLGGLGGILAPILQLVNQLLSSLTGGLDLPIGDITQLGDKVKAATSAVQGGAAQGVDPAALQAALAPLLSRIDQLLSSAGGNAGQAVRGTAGEVGTLVTSLGATEGLNKAVTDTVAGLQLPGPLGGVLGTVLQLLGNLPIVGPLLGGKDGLLSGLLGTLGGLTGAVGGVTGALGH